MRLAYSNRWGHHWHVRVVERDAPYRTLLEDGPYGRQHLPVRKTMAAAFERSLTEAILKGRMNGHGARGIFI